MPPSLFILVSAAGIVLCIGCRLAAGTGFVGVSAAGGRAVIRVCVSVAAITGRTIVSGGITAGVIRRISIITGR